MPTMEFRMVLTGARTGKTCLLGRQYQFVNGKATVRGDDKGVAGIVAYLGRFYKAFPANSRELEAAQAIDRANPKLKGVLDGISHLQAGAQPGGPAQVSDGVQPDGQGAPSAPAADGSEPAEGGQGAASPVPSGDGQPHAGDDGAPTQQDRIQQALSKLDNANDEHWTTDGKPRVETMAVLSGIANLNRAMIEAVGPNVVRKA